MSGVVAGVLRPDVVQPRVDVTSGHPQGRLAPSTSHEDADTTVVSTRLGGSRVAQRTEPVSAQRPRGVGEALTARLRPMYVPEIYLHRGLPQVAAPSAVELHTGVVGALPDGGHLVIVDQTTDILGSPLDVRNPPELVLNGGLHRRHGLPATSTVANSTR